MTVHPSAGIPHVQIFEEHGSVLPVWWQHRDTSGTAPRTVVYLDAHLDLQHLDPQHIDILGRCKDVSSFKQYEIPIPGKRNEAGIYGIENFLYPAAQLGLIDRLVWVVPPHIPRSYSPALVEYIQRMDGVSFDELTSFEPVGKDAARGKLLGLDITLCHYADLGELNIDQDYDLDVDIDYFVQVPGDTLWTDPEQVIESIIESLGSPRLATVSRAVSSGFTPLKHRFIADQVAATLRHDEMLSAYFKIVAAATFAIEQDNAEKGLTLCDQAIEQRPEQPAAYYTKSLAATSDEDAETLYNKARSCDDRYQSTLLERSTGICARKKAIKRDLIDQLERELNALSPEDPALPAVELAVAELLAINGQIGKSWSLLNRRKRSLDVQADTLLHIGAGLSTTDQLENAWRVLDMARQVDRTRTAAGQQLGLIAQEANRFDTALKFYHDVHQRAPAWLTPVERMVQCLKALDRDLDAQPVVEELKRRKSVLRQLTAESPVTNGSLADRAG